MRLRNGVAVIVSVVLLAAAGVIGILVNRSALQAADKVHRADISALAVNNGTLLRQFQMLAAGELNDFATEHTFRLSRDNADDRRLLTTLAAKSETFPYGVLLADLSGTVITSSRATGVPPATDTGWIPLRRALTEGQPGFSSVMAVNGTFLQAVAVPILRAGVPVAVLVGLNQISNTALQKYVVSLHNATYTTLIVDGTGTISQTDVPSRMGLKIDPALRAAARTAGAFSFIEFTDTSGVEMIAAVVGNLPGGSAYVRMQTLSSFDGAVHAKSQVLNYTLVAMLLIGVAAITVLGYRTMIQRRRADERFQALFQHAPDLVAVLDAQGTIEYASPSATAILGHPVEQITGSNVFTLVHPDERAYLQEQLGLLLGQRASVLRLQCRVASARGAYLWFELTASNQMHNPALNGVVINARDVSETRAHQDRMTHEAHHDALTGLPNRRRMQDALGTSLRTDAVAVLFVDLDGFKPVNDAHGHDAGDELLRQVAARLGSCVRENDVLSRVGGDEFVILMPGVHSPADTDATCARIREAISQPFLLDGAEVRIGASVGVHLAPPAGDPVEALRAADHAMYGVKNSRSGTRVGVGRHRAED